MASKLFVITLVVMLVGTACAMYDDEGNGYADGDGYGLDGGYQMDQFLDELHPMLAIKRDNNRDKAAKKYKSCAPVQGSHQECWCHRRSGKIFQCFGAFGGKK
ncbi:uncharacterized protein LOC105439745 [Strongylocentrotus purpuratus]|uniref:Uncharacterized protein n=1 Tax=Strongylocentrotus purpuratus TaxID=7668 RepID=A0A7M7SV20_STRPU|nr:uncharacterized protein LOC105439745 [Strongylocentrotus purpuratus]